jgi:hypothetical protein
MVKVDRFNPFHVNHIGSQGRGFPLSMRWQRIDGIFSAFGTALRASDLASAVATAVPPVCVVLNVGHTAHLDDGNRPLPLSAIAERKGVEAEVHDISWASERGSQGELLVVDASHLDGLLSGWSLYDIDVLWLADRPGSNELDEIALAINTRRGDDSPLLASLDEPRVYFNGHDDCYFYVECRDDVLLRLILRRLLALLAGSCMLATSNEVVIAEPGDAIVDALLGRAHAWVGDASSMRDNNVAVELTVAEWRLSQSVPYDPALTALYVPATAEWTLESKP